MSISHKQQNLEESIYNLIPPQTHVKPKGKVYKSIYPHDIQPTGSTLAIQSTSLGVSNVAGNIHQPIVNYSPYQKCGTLGRNHSVVIDPKRYLKKGEGTLVNYSRLPRITTEKDTVVNDRYSKSLKTAANQSIFQSLDEKKLRLKEAVPKKDDRPLMGLKSYKNFIVSNSINNILSSPPVRTEPLDYLKKKDYGKIPPYLEKRRDDIQTEYQMVQSMVLQEEEQNNNQMKMIDQAEIEELKRGLKEKYDQVNKKYQSLTHIGNIDTRVKKRIKEGCEQQLNQLEKDMEKLNKQYIFIKN